MHEQVSHIVWITHLRVMKNYVWPDYKGIKKTIWPSLQIVSQYVYCHQLEVDCYSVTVPLTDSSEGQW